jgi:geranyl-CoA carboxylase alpha subunit
VPEFSKLLVANRAEIACRVLRTARSMGYGTVAVYSAADRELPHVRLADEAVYLGPAPAAESYLNVERILDAARRSGADAVHPGYGFLSENAEFAEACASAGLIFVGPPAEAMRMMADKARAKAIMREAGVPIVPGFWGSADDRRLCEEAARIGFPLLVKATAGGGGRGIRLVTDPAGLQEALSSARREAAAAFGDGALMLERYVAPARHVEVQIFADHHGHVIHLGERDCSAQRRRQKIIEEAPCPNIGAELRRSLGDTAVSAARAVGYRGAGTVEFIVDAEGRYYFLEMNTRLQVEHPVTELITGLDLVRLQLTVAAGKSLPLTQSEVRSSGHAIEARLYAEDPAQSFAPQAGRLLRFDLTRASEQPGVRIDTGFERGSVITPHYDALIAKIVAHGETRSEARRRLARALRDAALFGPRTNAGFLHALLQSPPFAQAEMHTALIDGWLAQPDSLLTRAAPSDELWALAACLCAEGQSADGYRPRGFDAVELTLACDGSTRRARVVRGDPVSEVRFAETTVEIALLARDEGCLRYQTGTLQRRMPYLREADALHLSHDGTVFVFREPSMLGAAETEVDPRRVMAPIAGVVGRIAIGPGEPVRKGDVLVVIEAMKMETRVNAGAAARVTKIHCRPGEQVEANALLIELDPTPEEDRWTRRS